MIPDRVKETLFKMRDRFGAPDKNDNAARRIWTRRFIEQHKFLYPNDPIGWKREGSNPPSADTVAWGIGTPPYDTKEKFVGTDIQNGTTGEIVWNGTSYGPGHEPWLDAKFIGENEQGERHWTRQNHLGDPEPEPEPEPEPVDLTEIKQQLADLSRRYSALETKHNALETKVNNLPTGSAGVSETRWQTLINRLKGKTLNASNGIFGGSHNHKILEDRENF